MRRRIICTVAIFMLYAISAFAECAWVLWNKHESTYLYRNRAPEFSERWELHKAFATLEECKQIKQKIWEVTANRYEDLSQYKGIEKVDKVPYEAVFITLKESEHLVSGSQSQIFYCLPDTLDPRPKQ